jgi:predicted RNA-binding Zn ribbon-like protein
VNFAGYITSATTNLQAFDASPAKRFRLIGGDLCLDFCNTVGGKRETTPRENLHSYLHFLSWCQQASIVNESQSQALKRKALAAPDEAASVLSRALALREAIYRIFFSLIRDAKPLQADLDLLNLELIQAMGRLRITEKLDGHGYAWSWDNPVDLEALLGPVAHSAATLLTSHALLAQLHQCCGGNCGWLFLDCSKNHSRRWCDMRDCGNLAKVRRHRQKQRPESSRPKDGSE